MQLKLLQFEKVKQRDKFLVSETVLCTFRIMAATENFPMHTLLSAPDSEPHL